MDSLKLIQIEAMHALMKDTPEFNMREMQRWFSREFHTALTEVEELDIEYVAKHWFECKYKEMTPEEREEQLKLLTETPAERIERLRKEEAGATDDDEFLAQTIAEAQKAAAATKDLVSAIKNAQEPEPIIPVPVMGGPPTTFAEPPPPAPIKLPEGITMEFGNLDEDIDDWDLFGPPRKEDNK